MKKTIIFLLLLSILILSGCSSILISDNTELALEHLPFSPTATVKSLKNEQPGRVCALTENKKSILSIGRTNEMYTIDQFDIDSSTLVNITSSDTRILDVQAAADGFFYTKVNASSANTIQIVWSSSDRLVERTITDTVDSPDNAICVYGKNKIVYINNSSELVLADSNGIKKRYDLEGRTLIPNKIAWFPDKNIGFIIGKEAESNNYFLYRISLENEKVNIETINKNVLDIDSADQKNRLIYAVQEGNAVQVYQIDDNDMKVSNRIFVSNVLSELSYNNDCSAIYYSKPLENDVRSTIWIYLIDKNENIQLCSPLRLNSQILAPEQKDSIYFSANQLSYISNSELTQPFSYITKLVFEIKN